MLQQMINQLNQPHPQPQQQMQMQPNNFQQQAVHVDRDQLEQQEALIQQVEQFAGVDLEDIDEEEYE